MDTPTAAKSKTGVVSFSEKILDWYDRHARQMPWRIPPSLSKKGAHVPPYHTWLSEIMLQQTQVATVREYFLKFVERWPEIADLAQAESEEVMKAWAGLGYYSRARNLKKCADIIMAEHGGQFPGTRDELVKLPGIGEYTASAIAAIAFGEPVAVVDGNVERVISRQYRLAVSKPALKSQVTTLLEELVPRERPGDFAQAMMDLGATLCTPKNPACSLCPVNEICGAYQKGDMEAFPLKTARTLKPVRRGAAFVITNSSGAIYLQTRKSSGLLGGMSEVPTTGWNSRKDGETGVCAAPLQTDWKDCGTIRHTFTHFHLELEVWHGNSESMPGNGWWSAQADISGEALPSVMRKVIEAAVPGITRQV